MINKILKTLEEEMVLAQGCTEPIALALAAALATEELGSKPTKIHYELSGNMIKNVDGVVVPNSAGWIGIEGCGLLGAYHGKASKELLVIADVTDKQAEELKKKYLNKNVVTFERIKTDEKLYINVIVSNDKDKASVEIQKTHNNVTKVTKNGKEVSAASANQGGKSEPLSDRTYLTIKGIWDFINNNDITPELKEILDLGIKCNCSISAEGMKNDYGLNVGSSSKKSIDLKLASDDIRTSVPAVTAAGSDARMAGCSMPVMSVSGSGNQGMTCIISIIEFAKRMNIDEEKTYKAVLMSILNTVHIKTKIGRLSPYCGIIGAGAASAGPMVWLMEGNIDQASEAIKIVLADLSGVLCDGAKATCALKIQSVITSAIDASAVAMADKKLKEVGFLGTCIETTIDLVARLANDGMTAADETIFAIMEERGNKNGN